MRPFMLSKCLPFTRLARMMSFAFLRRWRLKCKAVADSLEGAVSPYPWSVLRRIATTL